MGLGGVAIATLPSVIFPKLMFSDRLGGKFEKLSGGRLCGKSLSATLRGLKAQQVCSPGQRPGYHVPIPYAL